MAKLPTFESNIPVVQIPGRSVSGGGDSPASLPESTKGKKSAVAHARGAMVAGSIANLLDQVSSRLFEARRKEIAEENKKVEEAESLIQGQRKLIAETNRNIVANRYITDAITMINDHSLQLSHYMGTSNRLVNTEYVLEQWDALAEELKSSLFTEEFRRNNPVIYEIAQGEIWSYYNKRRLDSAQKAITADANNAEITSYQGLESIVNSSENGVPVEVFEDFAARIMPLLSPDYADKVSELRIENEEKWVYYGGIEAYLTSYHGKFSSPQAGIQEFLKDFSSSYEDILGDSFTDDDSFGRVLGRLEDRSKAIVAHGEAQEKQASEDAVVKVSEAAFTREHEDGTKTPGYFDEVSGLFDISRYLEVLTEHRDNMTSEDYNKLLAEGLAHANKNVGETRRLVNEATKEFRGLVSREGMQRILSGEFSGREMTAMLWDSENDHYLPELTTEQRQRLQTEWEQFEKRRDEALSSSNDLSVSATILDMRNPSLTDKEVLGRMYERVRLGLLSTVDFVKYEEMIGGRIEMFSSLEPAGKAITESFRSMRAPYLSTIRGQGGELPRENLTSEEIEEYSRLLIDEQNLIQSLVEDRFTYGDENLVERAAELLRHYMLRGTEELDSMTNRISLFSIGNLTPGERIGVRQGLIGGAISSVLAPLGLSPLGLAVKLGVTILGGSIGRGRHNGAPVLSLDPNEVESTHESFGNWLNEGFQNISPDDQKILADRVYPNFPESGQNSSTNELIREDLRSRVDRLNDPYASVGSLPASPRPYTKETVEFFLRAGYWSTKDYRAAYMGGWVESVDPSDSRALEANEYLRGVISDLDEISPNIQRRFEDGVSSAIVPGQYPTDSNQWLTAFSNQADVEATAWSIDTYGEDPNESGEARVVNERIYKEISDFEINPDLDMTEYLHSVLGNLIR